MRNLKRVVGANNPARVIENDRLIGGNLAR
jgi:hypothetical protein